MMKSFVVAACIVAGLLTTSCSMPQGPNEKGGMMIGGVGGALAGGLLGASMGNTTGALIGAGLGAAAGGFLGKEVGKGMDNPQSQR
jgi:uncharacterized protein YcfJ